MKDLNVRIVDLETRSLNPPRPAATSRRLESRIEELTSQLNQTNKDSSRIHRSADKALHEAERQRARLEDEVKSYEEKILGMRHKMDELVSLPLAHVPCWTLIPFRSSRRRTTSSLPSAAQSAKLPTSSRKHLTSSERSSV